MPARGLEPGGGPQPYRTADPWLYGVVMLLLRLPALSKRPASPTCVKSSRGCAGTRQLVATCSSRSRHTMHLAGKNLALRPPVQSRSPSLASPAGKECCSGWVLPNWHQSPALLGDAPLGAALRCCYHRGSHRRVWDAVPKPRPLAHRPCHASPRPPGPGTASVAGGRHSPSPSGEAVSQSRLLRK